MLGKPKTTLQLYGELREIEARIEETENQMEYVGGSSYPEARIYGELEGILEDLESDREWILDEIRRREDDVSRYRDLKREI